MQIIWSDDAIADYHDNIQYLLSNWTTEVASNFISEVDAVITLIIKHPEIYPQTEYKSIRKAVIRKQISLFYKVEFDELYIIRFWNSFQNPELLKL